MIKIFYGFDALANSERAREIAEIPPDYSLIDWYRQGKNYIIHYEKRDWEGGKLDTDIGYPVYRSIYATWRRKKHNFHFVDNEENWHDPAWVSPQSLAHA